MQHLHNPANDANKVHWHKEWLQRYDLSGPRYTSYPTAPQFKDGYSENEVEAAITRSNLSGQPLSLYFHIPFCDTVCYYCGCNKIVSANKARAKPYLNSIYKELEIRAQQFDTTRPVNQLHWGGGTPTYISDTEKCELMEYTHKHFNLLDDDSGEYSIEIHPGGLTPDTLGLLRKLGFNRLSMGVQDFNPRVQKAVNRFNSVEEVTKLVARAKAEEFHSLSMDIIYGLPHQNLETIDETLNQIIDLNPERLSLFNYAHMPHLFKTQNQIDASALPEPQEKLAMLESAIEKLQAAGYVYIGMDHFAKPDDTLTIAQQQGELQRNFQGYATHGNCDLLAFGVSSISAINNIYVQNHKDITEYQRALENNALPSTKGITLSSDDQLRQSVINQLICHFNLCFIAVDKAYGIEFEDYFADALKTLEPMIEDGLIELNNRILTVTTDGRLLIRRICMAFDRYLDSSPTAKPQYSRII